MKNKKEFLPNLDIQLKFIEKKVASMLAEPLKQKQEKKQDYVKALQAINEKIYLLEKRYMDSEIEGPTYKTWFKQFQEEKAELEQALKGKGKCTSTTDDIIQRVLPWMGNLFGIYEKCDVYQKHTIIRGGVQRQFSLRGWFV